MKSIVSKKEIKKMINKFSEETKFISSIDTMTENRNFKKLEKIIKKEKQSKTIFKIIKSKLKENPFLFKLLEKITNQKTLINESDRGKINKIIDFWLSYDFKF